MHVLRGLVAGMLIVGAAGSAVASPEAFTEACMASTNLGQPVCTCCAEKAAAELSPTGLAFLVATLQEDEQQTTALRAQLSFTEALAAGMFMVGTPGRCAEELASP